MANIVNLEERSSPEERTPRGWQQYWQTEVDAAQKRLKPFQTKGNKVVQRYLDERPDSSNTTRLNLFHSNISILMSMLFGSRPQIDVSREHQDPTDDIARVSSNLYKRILEADVAESGETLSHILKSALQDRLLPGLGIARVSYEAEFGEEMDETGVTRETLVSESAPISYVHWQDFLWGWCRTWDEMPWMAFRVWVDRDEAEKRFGETKAKRLTYINQIPTGDQKTSEITHSDQENSTRKAEIWEIWCETERKVYWYHKDAELILDIKDDPLKLDGFWPVPYPMVANITTTLFDPVADYHMTQDLYNQIDQLATRIHIITKAVKVVGVYNKGEPGIKRMLQEGMENDLIPVDNWAMFGEKGGLQGQIDWFPVETVVGTLQTLRQVLADTIQMLNEVTGMSDLLRGGDTQQYTSDGTNQLKAKFGSIRIQALQDDFARFASDLNALKAEVISKHFDQGTIVRQSGAMFLPEPDKKYLAMSLQLMKSRLVKWRINIRPESIAMVDYAQLRNERTEFLNGMATFIQSAQAAIKAVPGSAPMLMEMLKWGMAGFKGSDYLEGIMDEAIEGAKKELQNPQQNQPSPEQMKLEATKLQQQTALQKGQQELQKIQAKAQADMQNTQMKIQGEIAKIRADSERDLTLEQRDHMNALEKIARELDASLTEIQANLEADVTLEEAQARFDIAERNVDHQHNMTEITAGNRGNNDG